MIEIVSGLPAHSVGFKLSGKLHDEDYKRQSVTFLIVLSRDTSLSHEIVWFLGPATNALGLT